MSDIPSGALAESSQAVSALWSVRSKFRLALAMVSVTDDWLCAVRASAWGSWCSQAAATMATGARTCQGRAGRRQAVSTAPVKARPA